MLASLVEAGDAILIKGSRGVKTEKVLEVLSEKFEMERSEAVKR
jgi:UDP-N-acetylmuramyl pentapeptide synthase